MGSGRRSRSWRANRPQWDNPIDGPPQALPRSEWEEVGRIGDFFQLIRPPQAGGTLDQLVVSGDRYEQRLDATGATLARLLGADQEALSRRALASLVFLGLAARLVAPVLAGAALFGRVPVLTLETVQAVELPDGRVVLRLVGEPPVSMAPVSMPPVSLAASAITEVGERADRIGTQLIGGQIGRLVAAFARRDALHPRLLWGNVASTVVSAAGLVAAHSPARATVAWDLAGRLLDAAPLAECGTVTRGAEGAEGLRYVRRSCCLYYQFPHAGTCGDCPLPPRSVPTVDEAGPHGRQVQA